MLKDIHTRNYSLLMGHEFRLHQGNNLHFINSGSNTCGGDNVLNPIFSLLVYQSEMVISYIFFTAIHEHRYTPFNRILIGSILFAIASGINIMFHNNGLINIATTFVVNVLFSTLCFDTTIYKSSFYSALLGIINAVVEVTVVFYISYIIGNEFGDYNDNLLLAAFLAVTIKTLYFLIILVLIKAIHPEENQNTFPFTFLIYPICASVCQGIFWHICSMPNTTYHTQFLLAIASICIFVSSILLFVTYSHQLKAAKISMQVTNEMKRLQSEQSYYHILEQQNQQLMIYAHDAKNHLTAIKCLSQDPQINGYVTKLSDQLAEYTRNCHSGNKLLDVMIHKFCIECEMKNIRFEYDIKLCNLSDVEDIDLVAILGNLIDNAITAADKSRKRTVSFATAKRNSYNILVITNSCDDPPQLHGQNLITSKADSNRHGFGLKSVKKTLKKYQGDFEWEYDTAEHTFTITVMVGEQSKNT